jgi:hypothetical protein
VNFLVVGAVLLLDLKLVQPLELVMSLEQIWVPHLQVVGL